MEEWLLTGIAGFGALLALLVIGMPIGFALGSIGLVGSFIVVGSKGALGMLGVIPLETATKFILVCIPLFILMAEFAVISGISSDLYTAIHKWTGHLPGGLAIASIIACGVFGAISGSAIATSASIGRVAVPEMIKRGYDKKLSIGSIAAAGGVGIVIPPSLVFITFGFLGELPIGTLFIAGIIPGIILVILYSLQILLMTLLRPHIAPRVTGASWSERLIWAPKVLPMMLIILAVLGTIYLGVATPTEAAAIGAFGTFCLALFKKSLNLGRLREATSNAARTTSSILIILIGALCFGYFLSVSGFTKNITDLIVSIPLSRWWIMIIIQAFLFVLGGVLDVGGIVAITTPIFVPALTALGFDPIWFGVLLAINMDIASETPPVGLNVYVIRSIFKDIASLEDIFKGAVPFVLAESAGLALVMAFPSLALWLPQTIK